ncbi:MAG: hypothetical protein LQ348_001802 [Seirophora lacunosa]|nr:MAG: hypothetical protein LQ348_001802 [Seirophora lacunosa]
MGYWRYMLIPFSPVIATICLLVFIYERIALNKQERVGNAYTISKILDYILNWVFFILIFPAFICGTRFIIWIAPITLTLGLWVPVWHFLRKTLWYPLFRDLVPACYFSWNSRVYGDLRQGSQQVRILKLHPGLWSANIAAELITADLNTSTLEQHYEALSYSWGGHWMLRRSVTLNGCSYLVADTVYNALKELRLPKKERWLWIDAICINQGNLEERGWQVALMDSIYRKAEKVIVWLGKGSPQLDRSHGAVFRVIRNADKALPTEIDSIRDPIAEMMRARWWSRVWIVQEVALAASVVVRSGPNEVSWDTLTACLERLASKPEQGVDKKVLSFVSTIAELKSSNGDQGRSLLDMALRFRDRVAGNPRDKLLGYLGLLQQPTESLILENPYRKSAGELFAHFAASCITSSGSLAMVAIAEGLAVQKASWAVDWAMMTSPDWRDNDPLAESYSSSYNEPPTAFWNGDLLPSVSESTGRRYSATQSLPAVSMQKGLSWNSLYLNGWRTDTVKSCCDFYSDVKATAKTIRSWEKLAGGPWKNEADLRRVRFFKTLVADAWSGILPQDWPERCQERLQRKSLTSNEVQPERDIEAQPNSFRHGLSLSTSEQVFHASCLRRRFFITQRGRFGLGGRGVSEKSEVWALLGSHVPFILSPSSAGTPSKFLGQAYVDGLMNYKGDLQEDLRTHKVTTCSFWIR